jgi:transposase-like protein
MFSVVKTTEREAARHIRATEGASVKEIAARLSVSTSSVSHWVREIELTAEQFLVLEQRGFRGRLIGAARNRERSYLRRLSSQREERERAAVCNPRHMAGCMLFWAEGSRSRNSVCFTNSDPAMVRFFLDFLVEEIGVPRDAVRVEINLFADHRAYQDRLEDFWLRYLELPRRCMRSSTVNVYSRDSKKKRTNRLPYGTCRLVLHSTHVVHHLYGAIQEYGGFERDTWLD